MSAPCRFRPSAATDRHRAFCEVPDTWIGTPKRLTLKRLPKVKRGIDRNSKRYAFFRQTFKALCFAARTKSLSVLRSVKP